MREEAEVRSQKLEARRQKCGLLIVALMAMVMLSCAKKMLPPSPDRFPPRLQEVDTRTRSQVALVFDEEIDGAKLRPDSFRLTGPAGETLALRGASLGRNSDEVQLWTPIQELKLYEVRGIVWDKAGNPARFRARFQGSSKRDTIPPRVTRIEPGPGAARQKHEVAVRVTFSEAIDTTSLGMAGETLGTAKETSGTVRETLGIVPVQGKSPGAQSPYMFVPAAYDTLFKRSWSSDWQSLGFVHRESMPGGALVYFLLQPKVTDLEGNRVKGSAFTFFTSDTILEAAPVKGKATWSSMLGAGAVFFTESAAVHVITDSLKPPRTETLPVRTTGLAPLLTDGSFATKLRKGEYEVVAVADTNADGLADLVSRPVKFNTDAESLSLVLVPESLPKPINAYRR